MTLREVSDAAWDSVAPEGTDAVWLMGVWERSPAGLAIAKANDEHLSSFRDAPALAPHPNRLEAIAVTLRLQPMRVRAPSLQRVPATGAGRVPLRRCPAPA